MRNGSKRPSKNFLLARIHTHTNTHLTSSHRMWRVVLRTFTPTPTTPHARARQSSRLIERFEKMTHYGHLGTSEKRCAMAFRCWLRAGRGGVRHGAYIYDKVLLYGSGFPRNQPTSAPHAHTQTLHLYGPYNSCARSFAATTLRNAHKHGSTYKTHPHTAQSAAHLLAGHHPVIASTLRRARAMYY